MIVGSVLTLVLLAGVSAATPHLVARGQRRSNLVRLDAISSVVLLAAWHSTTVLGVTVAPATAAGLFLAAKIVLFAAFVAREGDEDLDWTPGRAGLLAFLVYLAIVPAVLEWPVDGDEAFYVLQAESMLHDRDLDLRNQYDNLAASVTRRLDLEPQFGDPVGPAGELHSRHEPLLSLLLVPGIAAFGLPGAVATIALLAALAVRAIVALLAEEGIGVRAQMFVFAFVGLAPPFLNYAVRIWPEAPGALLLAEILLAARKGNVARAIVFGVLLSALKLRFIPIAVTLLVVVLVAGRIRARWLVAGLAAFAVVLATVWIAFPGVIESRTFDPRAVFLPDNFARGLLGVLVDGHGGLLFQAPLLLLALAALLRWRALGTAAKLGCLTALPYLLLLLPRSEWHGGWSPPLRYLVVFAPVLALLLATSIERVVGRVTVAVAAAWTAGLAAHAVAIPPGLFRIASGESALGEHLSRIWGSDVSRLVPSLIRLNEAALWMGVAVVLAIAVVAVRRGPVTGARWPMAAAVLSGAVALTAWAGLQPGRVVEFEDAHVRKHGGALHPEMWTVARFRYRGGWTLQAGDAVSFRHRGGLVSLEYYCDQPTVIAIDGVEIDVPTGPAFADLVVLLEPTKDDWHEIRCLTGALILDRLVAE